MSLSGVTEWNSEFYKDDDKETVLPLSYDASTSSRLYIMFPAPPEISPQNWATDTTNETWS